MNNGANEGYMQDRMQANSNVAAGGSAPSCPRPLGCGRRTWRDRRAGIARGVGQDHARSRAPDRRRCRLHDPRDSVYPAYLLRIRAVAGSYSEKGWTRFNAARNPCSRGN